MKLTTEIYWASRHPDVAALNALERMSDERSSAALELVKRGFTIDPDIDLGRWDAAFRMEARESFLFKWVPSLGQQPIVFMPDIVPQGPAPVGSIKVSTDAADYPAFAPPVPVPLPVELPRVGSYIGFNLWNSNDRESPDGTRIEFEGKTLVKVTMPGFPPGTILHWWQGVA